MLSTDPAVRGAVKADLMEHRDGNAVPLLLEALPGASGSNREVVLEVLGAYDDPRKIPVYLALLKPFHWDSDANAIAPQLARLGAPAARHY